MRNKKFSVVVAAVPVNGLIGDSKMGTNGGIPWKKKKGDFAKDGEAFARITTIRDDSFLFDDAEERTPPNEACPNAVIMGPKTWKTFPKRFKPLPGRLNVIVSKTYVLSDEEKTGGVEVFPSLTEALKSLYERDNIWRIFVIGGKGIYEEALVSPDCEALYLTEVLDPTIEGDIFVNPKLLPPPNFSAVGFASELEVDPGTSIPFQFRVFLRDEEEKEYKVEDGVQVI